MTGLYLWICRSKYFGKQAVCEVFRVGVLADLGSRVGKVWEDVLFNMVILDGLVCLSRAQQKSDSLFNEISIFLLRRISRCVAGPGVVALPETELPF